MATLPVFHGGATPGASLAGYGFALLAFSIAAGSRRPTSVWERTWGTVLAVLALAVLAWLQSVGLPSRLVAVLSPERLELARETAEVTGAVGATRIPLSLAASTSRWVGFELASLAAAIAAAGVVFRRRSRRRWLFGAALIAGLTQVVLGAGPLVAGRVPRLRGSYINSDHLALLLEVGTAMCFAALVWALVSRRWSKVSEARWLWVAALSLALLALLVGNALTGSRAAALATLGGLVAQGGLLIRSRGLRRTLVAALIPVTAIAGFVSWVGASQLFSRLLGTSWYDIATSGRIGVWRESLPLIARFPWLGTGIGGFREAHALVGRDSSVAITWAKAHNDYLELWITGGLAGLAILVLGSVWTLRSLIGKFAAAERNEDRLFVLGALGALASVGIHEFLDFGLTLPANGLLVAVVVGAALAVAPRATGGAAHIASAGRKVEPASRRRSTRT